jgi:Predicted membrane protein
MSYYSFSDVFRHCYLNVLKHHYFDCRGRATRSEYWFFMLLMSLPMSFFYGLGMIDLMIYAARISPADYSGGSAGSPLETGLPILTIISITMMCLWNLFHLIPSFGVTVRRLHDTGRSGWHMLIGLIPLVGGFIVLYFFCLDSQPGANRFGPNPKEQPPQSS